MPKSAFAFLDETGSLGGERDPVFAVGLLRCPEPYTLLRPMQRLRDRNQFYDEIKWNKVSAKKLPVLMDLADVFFGCQEASFSTFVCDKSKYDIIGRYGGQFEAYEALARQLVLGSLRRDEHMWIIADEYSTPPKITFEENVRDWVNGKAKTPAVAGVCRMRSDGVDLLQLIDLLLGAVLYEFKTDRGVAGSFKPKQAMLDYVKRKVGVETFLGGYRDDRINVLEYNPSK